MRPVMPVYLISWWHCSGYETTWLLLAVTLRMSLYLGKVQEPCLYRFICYRLCHEICFHRYSLYSNWTAKNSKRIMKMCSLYLKFNIFEIFFSRLLLTLYLHTFSCPWLRLVAVSRFSIQPPWRHSPCQVPEVVQSAGSGTESKVDDYYLGLHHIRT